MSNENLIKEIARTQDRYVTLLRDSKAILDRWWDKAAGENEMALAILTELELVVETSEQEGQ